MARRGSRVLWLALAGIFALPGAAHAVCAQTSLLEREKAAERILLARALPGETDPRGNLVSPARFRVLRYEKGSGPREVRATTATRKITTPSGAPGYVTESESLDARAGGTYRIFGRRSRTGIVRTDGCSSSAVPSRPRRITVAVAGGQPRQLPVTDIRGERPSRRLPRITAPPGRALGLGPGFVPPDTVLTRAGSYTPFGRRFGNGWRLPRRLPARTRIVVHTGKALYAFTLVRGR